MGSKAFQPFRAFPIAVLVLAGTLVPEPGLPQRAPAPPERPRPYPVVEIPGFTRAVERGTRTRTGRPGPNYWQQYAEYRLSAELDPGRKLLTGRGSVRYHNRSPDALPILAVQLYQNVYRPEALHNRFIPATSGVELTRVVAQGQTLQRLTGERSGPGYWILGTVAFLQLPTPLAPGQSIDLEFDWNFPVPPTGSPRMGQDGEVFFLGYWYPQIAVYDDVNGWQVDQYMPNAEFYMGYADYDVAITVPEGWLVAATGTLQNPEEVLSPTVRERLQQARRQPQVVQVVRANERGRATARGQGGRLTWRFQARNVRDFAWAASERFVWDSTHAVVGDANGDGRPDTAAIYTFYRPERGSPWDQWARYARHSVEFLSRYLWPYPWPHMTAVEGLISGGMEYPMVTLIGGTRDSTGLYSVTVHEIGHMWFPMMVGSDEKRYAWQDEGLTTFNQQQGLRDFTQGRLDPERGAREAYLELARVGPLGEFSGGEVQLLRHGDLYPPLTPAFGIASYNKMSVIMQMLRALLGEETFLRAYREYGRRWLYRHPQPWDFWYTFNDVAGQDLWWFWRTWFYETWPLDQAITEVRAAGDSVEIVIEDRGMAPMPVRLAVTRDGNRVDRLEVPVNVWLEGARRTSVRVAGSPVVVRVEIDPEQAFADIDRQNQVWTGRVGR